MIILDHEQNTPEWFAARLGLPTASNASQLITSKGERSSSLPKYAKKLAADKFAEKEIGGFAGNSHTEFGHEYEGEARLWYAFEKSVEPVETGFITDNLKRFGCSPDSLIDDDGLFEAKCKPKLHTDALLYIHKHGKPPTDYLAQCHMQMLVTDRAWTDLCYYHPDLPRKIMRIERDSKFDDALKSAITECIQIRDETVAIFEELAA